MADNTPQSVETNLSSREQELLYHAIRNTKVNIEIDFEAFRQAGGFKTLASAKTTWSNLKKKVTAGSNVASEGSSKTSQKAPAAKDNTIKTPKSTTKAKRSTKPIKTETEGDEMDVDDAGEGPASPPATPVTKITANNTPSTKKRVRKPKAEKQTQTSATVNADLGKTQEVAKADNDDDVVDTPAPKKARRASAKAKKIDTPASTATLTMATAETRLLTSILTDDENEPGVLAPNGTLILVPNSKHKKTENENEKPATVTGTGAKKAKKDIEGKASAGASYVETSD